jgi:hypothetical protein
MRSFLQTVLKRKMKGGQGQKSRKLPADTMRNRKKQEYCKSRQEGSKPKQKEKI